MKRPRTGDVVEVEWTDSEFIRIGWSDVRSYRDAAKLPQGYRTAGYWLKPTKKHYVVVLNAGPKNGHVSEAISIPRVAVERITVLGRAHKSVRKALKRE